MSDNRGERKEELNMASTRSATALVLLMVLAVSFALAAPANAVPFTADITQRIGDTTTSGKVYVGDNAYRMDLAHEGSEISIIAPSGAGIISVLAHADTTIMHVKSGSPMSMALSPFEGFSVMMSQNRAQFVGTDSYEGYDCTEFEVFDGDELIMTTWVSQKLGRPLRIVLPGEPPRIMELSNIEEGPVDETLFDIPTDYRDVTQEEASPEHHEGMHEHHEDETLMGMLHTTVCERVIRTELSSAGVELKTEAGTIQLHRKVTPALEAAFPDWLFFDINREREVEGGKSFGFVDYSAAACMGERTILLDSPATSSVLDDALALIDAADLTVMSEEDAELLAGALHDMYFDRGSVAGVEHRDDGTWALNTLTRDGREKHFVIAVGENGTVTDVRSVK
jgi:hypothetical protein